jgi:hypothetical protein
MTPEKGWRKVKSYSSKAPWQKASDIKHSIEQAVAKSNAHVKNYSPIGLGLLSGDLNSGGFVVWLNTKLLSFRLTCLEEHFSSQPLTFVTNLVALVKRAIETIVLELGLPCLQESSQRRSQS